LLSQGEASIAFCRAFAHCNGSGSLSHSHRTHRPFTPRTRATGAETSAFRKPCVLAGSSATRQLAGLTTKLNRRERDPNQVIFIVQASFDSWYSGRFVLHWRWLPESAPGRFG
jgi:hypothetical protein